MYNKREYKSNKPGREKCKTCKYNCKKCEDMYKKNPTSHTMRDALCWCCAKATDGSCQYMMTGKVYEDTVYHTKRLRDGTVGTNISDCPKFVRG